MFSYGLDGDNIRSGLCADLTFNEKDRNENIRRVTEVSKLFADAGTVSICSFVSPFKESRDFARRVHESANLKFIEVYVNTPLSECELRDPKGLYKKARNHELSGFTGIDQAYEEPNNPELKVNTVQRSVYDCVKDVLDVLRDNNIISPDVVDDAEAWFKINRNGLVTKVQNHAQSLDLVAELFVAPDRKGQVLAEAETLKDVHVSKIDLQWIQVNIKYYFV